MSGPGMSEQDFLARVRAALGRGGAERSPADPPAVNEALGRVHASDDAVTRFAEQATAVGMHVHPEVTDVDLPERLADLLRQRGVRRPGVAAEVIDAFHGLDASLRDGGFDVVACGPASELDPQFDLDAGVTLVDAAIAESGALVCRSGPGRSRGLSLVPPIHVAIVRAEQVVADLLDAVRQWSAEPRDLPSNITLITGPSKTADIEGQLVTGVHGPGEVHILLLNPVPSAAAR